MKLIDILPPERIVHRLQASSKPELLVELVQHGFLDGGCGLSGDDADRVLQVIDERERLGSTGIGDGVAIPHGKLAGLAGLLAAFGIQEQGVDFGAADGKPSRFFVLLLAPENSANAHLKALARISRLFRDGGFRRRLLGAPDRQTLYDTLAREDARQ